MLTEKQKENRFNGIGGSDISAILGISPYKTPVELFNEKINKTVDYAENFSIKRGNALEPIIIEEYENITGNIVYNHGTIHDKEHNFLFANLDGYVENDMGEIKIVVEAKSTNRKKIWGEPGTDQIPDYYLAQAAHYAYITDCEKVDIAVAFNDSVNLYYYSRNEELEKAIRNKAIEFWNLVTKRIPPAPLCKNDIELIYKCSGTSIEADAAILKDLESFISIKETIKNAQNKEKKIRDKIAIYLKNNEILTYKGKTIATYKEQKAPKRIDVKRLQKENPDIAKQYTISGNAQRRLLIK
jgi:putative phage-type endonuclease